MVASLREPETIANEIASSPWAESHRANGAAITVQSQNGKYYHADEQIWAMTQRSGLATNGYDLIPPGMAAKGAEMLGAHAGKSSRVWFPCQSGRGDPVWCRFESSWHDGVLACAIWLEQDSEKGHLQAESLEP